MPIKFNIDDKIDTIRNEVFLKNMRNAIADSFEEVNELINKVDDNVAEALKEGAIKYKHMGINSIGYDQQRIHEGILWEYGIIEVDTTNKTIKVNSGAMIGYSNRNSAINEHTIEYDTGVAQWVYLNASTNNLVIYANRDEAIASAYNLISVCVIFKGRVYGINKDKIKVDGITGGETPYMTSQEAIIYPTNSDRIKISYDDETYTITAEYNLDKKPYILQSFCGYVAHPNDINETNYKTSNTVLASKYEYVYHLFINRVTKELEFYDFTVSLSEKQILNLVYICSFSKTYFSGCKGSYDTVSINGKIVDNKNAWDSDTRFIMPKDLYFIKGMDYSLLGANAISKNLYNNNEIGFEMCLPNKTVEFTTNADLSFNIEGSFESKIGTLHNRENKAIYQDIKLHIKDSANVTNKSPKILCIGDSITNANFPSHCKWWLKSLGINPTMIGTQNNRNDGYKYGISSSFSSTYAKGEGRPSWRLSDYACKTLDLNNDPLYNQDNPFMKPSTLQFDFEYYMNNNGFDDVDFVFINLGTNDITGSHIDENAKKLTLSENLDNLKTWYDIIIKSIHSFNPNIKIGINPPLTSLRETWEGLDFNECSKLWAEKVISLYKDKENVQVLGSYLGMGNLITASNTNYTKTTVQSGNDTYKHTTSTDVHPNGMGQLIFALWSISWVVNNL